MNMICFLEILVQWHCNPTCCLQPSKWWYVVLPGCRLPPSNSRLISYVLRQGFWRIIVRTQLISSARLVPRTLPRRSFEVKSSVNCLLPIDPQDSHMKSAFHHRVILSSLLPSGCTQTSHLRCVQINGPAAFYSLS